MRGKIVLKKNLSLEIMNEGKFKKNPLAEKNFNLQGYKSKIHKYKEDLK